MIPELDLAETLIFISSQWPCLNKIKICTIDCSSELPRGYDKVNSGCMEPQILAVNTQDVGFGRMAPIALIKLASREFQTVDWDKLCSPTNRRGLVVVGPSSSSRFQIARAASGMPTSDSKGRKIGTSSQIWWQIPESLANFCA